MRCPYCGGYASPEGQTGVYAYYRCNACGATFTKHILTGVVGQK